MRLPGYRTMRSVSSRVPCAAPSFHATDETCAKQVVLRSQLVTTKPHVMLFHSHHRWRYEQTTNLTAIAASRRKPVAAHRVQQERGDISHWMECRVTERATVFATIRCHR